MKEEEGSEKEGKVDDKSDAESTPTGLVGVDGACAPSTAQDVTASIYVTLTFSNYVSIRERLGR